MWGVSEDELWSAQDGQIVEPNTSWHPMNPAIIGSAKVILDSKYLPISYGNVNPIRRKLVHNHIHPYMIFLIHQNTVELALPHYMTIYDPLNINKLEFDCTENSNVGWELPPLLEIMSRIATCSVVESIHQQNVNQSGSHTQTSQTLR